MSAQSFFKKRESPLTLNTEEKKEEEKRVETPVVAPVIKKVQVVEEPKKVKYTAVMDADLRVRIKIAAAKKNLQISEFIEAAVSEKLEREGL